MYIYFLPLASDSPIASSSCLRISPDQSQSAAAHTPTPDGGLEHTSADFHSPAEWLSLASSGKIILYPPQFFLLTLISSFLSPTPLETSGACPNRAVPDATLRGQREALVKFIQSGDPPWGEKCISPQVISRDEGRVVLALDSPGPELQGTNRKGDSERVIVLNTKRGDRTTPALEVTLRGNIPERMEREKL